MESFHSFEFIIPLSLDALQEASSTRHYVVTNISIAQEIPARIQETVTAFKQTGPAFIINGQNFDNLYSILVNFSAVNENSKQKAWALLLKELEGKLDEENISGSEKHQWLNILKMTTYLACNLMEAFEKNHNKPTIDTIQIGKSRKKAQKAVEDGSDWEEDRNHMLLQLFSLLQHPLQRLWEPPVMEEDYVNLIANCCYKILEAPSISLVRTKLTRDSVFQIIGTLVKKFNHGLGCSLKMMQLLQHFQHMVTPAAQGIIILTESFNVKTIVSDMIREIAKVDLKDLMKDSSGLRNFSQFITELSDKSPKLVMPSLSLLINFLHEEAYFMRTCVLSTLGSVILKVLNGDNLEEKSKELRDQCLDHLEDHIHDVQAFVRSRALQVWSDLITEKAVPLSRQQRVLNLVLGRLQDKSLVVRKNAVQLLTAFIKGNPFAAKLPLEELESQFETELKKLQEMAPGIEFNEDGDLEMPKDKDNDPSEMWKSVLVKVVDAVLKEASDGEGEVTGIQGDVELNDVVTSVAEVLMAGKYKKAVKLLEAALETFGDAEIFGYNEEECSVEVYEDMEDEEFTPHHLRLLVVLERIFMSAKAMEGKVTNKGNGDDKTPVDEEANKAELEAKKREIEINKQKLLVVYLKDSVGFAKLIHKALPVMCQLLNSKQSSDILEAISFFITAYEFGMLNAMTGVRRMLALVWSKEQDIKTAVVEAYQRLYIDVDASNERARALQIVRNLSALVIGASLGERTSMEEIISQFVVSGEINKHCVMLMWELFTKALPDTTDEQAHAALILLAMCANTEVSIITSNISVLINSGLGEHGACNFALVKETCSALMKHAVTKPKTDAPNAPLRYEQSHVIFDRLSQILVEGLTVLEDRQYSPMAIEAVSTIYALAEHPDLICGEIIKKICKILLTTPPEETSEMDQTSPSQQQSNTVTVGVGVLTRFYVVVGHVALRQLAHLDTYIFSEMKRRTYLKEEMENEKQVKRKRKSKRKSLATSAIEASRSELDVEEDMGLTGAVADDMEAEFIRTVCDTELLNSDNLLGSIRSLIWAVCSNPGKYKDPELRTAATLAFAKIIMVSSEVCEGNLQLLFTILEKSEEPTIRANVIIALGDLSFRFPNQLEPWTPHLYARLRDSSPRVRQNTLTILTHLILNDMVKVKGQISDIALCMNDEDPRISGLANLFFSELGRKGNALYNVLPDIISRLSDPELGIKEPLFRKIIGHIFSLIQKEKHHENLVEKLCHRFQATINVRQWRDIAYCLSLLQFNEKAIRKLSENFSCFADKLYEPEVHEFFLGILAGALKTAKPESRVSVEELEQRVEQCHQKGVEDENLVNKAAHAKTKGRTSHTGKVQKKRQRRSAYNSSDEDSDFENKGEGPGRQTLHPAHRDSTGSRRKSNRRVTSQRRVRIQDLGDETDSDDENGPEK
ncbi:hypothetical protein Pmani_032152 [Petrolisthes manimaculis]|uniref:Condensin complex subunit 1 n=1 Tax=Petrolisthes manimaculis TaxID=1843537 RepID=A0AAE1NSC0_9EUCA|nr:hypothetical protein Pmani_032152 [Petrolisthes manimaculis]